MNKKKSVFIIAFAVCIVILAVLAIIVVPRKKYSFPLDENKLNVVIVGDSMFCNEFEGKNLGGILENKLNCEMLNCSVGGTCASKLNQGNELDYYSDKLGFYNVSNIVCTGNKASVSDNVRTLSVYFDGAFQKIKLLAGTNFKKEDVLIVNYGVNDAFLRVSATSNDKYDENTFSGAVRCGVERINKEYPDLKIVLGEVTYATLIVNGESDVYYDEITAEYRAAYNEELKKIANEYDNVYYFDFSDYLNIDSENQDKYFHDGIHFNDEGMKIYAASMAEFIGEIN